MKYCILMPTYNEIGQLANSVAAIAAQNLDVGILIIDDNSPDGTGQLADQLAAESQKIEVLHRDQKGGLGKAYVSGFQWAVANGVDYVIQMDADGSHRAQDIAKLIQASTAGTLVIGSRWVSGGEVVNWPAYRAWISRAGNFYARIALGNQIKDLTAGFRCYPIGLIQSLDLGGIQSQGYGFQVEMTKACLDKGANVVEVPITFVERESGSSKMTIGIIIEAFLLCTKWLFRR